MTTWNQVSQASEDWTVIRPVANTTRVIGSPFGLLLALTLSIEETASGETSPFSLISQQSITWNQEVAI